MTTLTDWLDAQPSEDEPEDGSPSPIQRNLSQDLQTPDEAAADAQVGEVVGRPRQAVTTYRDVFTRAAEAQQIERATESTPRLRRWLENQNNLAVSRDDVENLAPFERMSRDFRQWRRRLADEAVKAAGGQEEFNLRLWRNMQDPTGLERVTRRGQAVVELADTHVRMAQAGRVGRPTRDEQRQIDTLRNRLATRDENRIPVVSDIAEQLPFTGEIWGEAGRFLAEGAEEADTTKANPIQNVYETSLGARLVGGNRIAEIESGLAFDEMSQFRTVDGRPIDPNIAARYAAEYGVWAAGLESAELGGIIEIVRAGALLRGPTKAVLRRVVLRQMMARAGLVVTGGALTGATQEGLQEAAQIERGEAAQAADVAASGGEYAQLTPEQKRERITESVRVGAVTGGGLSAVLGSPGLVEDAAAVARARANEETFEALAKGTQSSQTAQRLPSAMQSAVNEMTADSPIENVLIEGDAFAEYFQSQGGDPFEAMDQLGLDREQLRQALASGGDVAIPTGVYAARVAGTPAHKALIQHARFRPDDVTPARLAQAETEIKTRIEEALDEVVANTDDDEIGQVVETRVKELLDNAYRDGGTNPQVNARYAKLYAALPRAIMALARKGSGDYAQRTEKFLRTLFGQGFDVRGPAQAGEQGQALEGAEPMRASATPEARRARLEELVSEEEAADSGSEVLEQAKSVGYEGADTGEAAGWLRAQAKGLDVSTEARKARAEEQGFDTSRVVYHTTTRDFTQFNDDTVGGGVYVTPDPAMIAADASRPNSQVMPLFLRRGRLLTTAEMRSLTYAERRQAVGWDHPEELTGHEIIIFDARNIRSANAAFDPDESGSADILAQSDFDESERVRSAAERAGGAMREIQERTIERGAPLETRTDSGMTGRREPPAQLPEVDSPEWEAATQEALATPHTERTPVQRALVRFARENEAGAGYSGLVQVMREAKRIVDSVADENIDEQTQALVGQVAEIKRAYDEFARAETDNTRRAALSEIADSIDHMVEDAPGVARRIQTIKDAKKKRANFELLAQLVRQAWRVGRFEERGGELFQDDGARPPVSEPIPGEATNSRRYGFPLGKHHIVVNIAPEPSGGHAAAVDWTFLRRYTEHEALYDRGSESLSASELRELFRGLNEVIRQDAAEFNRPAYVFTPQTEAHRKVYGALVRQGIPEGYSVLQAPDVDDIYIARDDIDVSGNGELLYLDPDRPLEPLEYETLGDDELQWRDDDFYARLGAATPAQGRVRSDPDGGGSGSAGRGDGEGGAGPGPSDSARSVEELAQSRDIDRLGFFSVALEAANALPDRAMRGEEAINRIGKARGVSGFTGRVKDEIDFLGLREEFGDKKSVTKDEIVEYIRAHRLVLDEAFNRFDPRAVKQRDERWFVLSNQDGGFWFKTQREANEFVAQRRAGGEQVSDPFDEGPNETDPQAAGIRRGPGDLRLPGDEPVFELRLKIPPYRPDDMARMNQFQQQIDENRSFSPEEQAEFEELRARRGAIPGSDFQSHWSHPPSNDLGVLVSVRGEERVDDKGQRTLFGGEVQSDMAQAARQMKEARAEAAEKYEQHVERRDRSAATLRTLGVDLDALPQSISRIILSRTLWPNGNGRPITAEVAEQAVPVLEELVTEYSRNDPEHAANIQAALPIARQISAGGVDGWQAVADSYWTKFAPARPGEPLDFEAAPLASKTSQWTGAAVRAILYRAARDGFDSVSFPTGETSKLIQGNDSAAAHYDTNVKGALEKAGRPFGGEVRLGSVDYAREPFYRVTDANGVVIDEAAQERMAQQTAEGSPGSKIERISTKQASAYVLDITPEMRSRIVSDGLPLFQNPSREGKRGSILLDRFANDGSLRAATINLFEASDLSTFLHESGHLFLEILQAVSLDEQAPQELKDMWASTQNWFGLQPGQWESMTLEQRRERHELWARTFEQYLMEGKAPSLGLREAFAAFKAWLLQIYRTVMRLDSNLTPEIRDVFDRLLATEQEMAEARAAAGLDKGVFATREESGMSESAWAQYQEAIASAREAQEAELRARVMETYTRKQKRWWRSERARIRPTVEREVDSDPARRAHDWLAFGEWRDLPAETDEDGNVAEPTPAEGELTDKPEDLPAMKLSAQALVDDYGEGIFNELPPALRPARPEDIEQVLADAMALKKQGKTKRPLRLAAFLRQLGGLKDEGGEIVQALGNAKMRPGLINKASGLGLDEAALAAYEAGYFGQVRKEPREGLFQDAGEWTEANLPASNDPQQWADTFKRFAGRVQQFNNLVDAFGVRKPTKAEAVEAYRLLNGLKASTRDEALQRIKTWNAARADEEAQERAAARTVGGDEQLFSDSTNERRRYPEPIVQTPEQIRARQSEYMRQAIARGPDPEHREVPIDSGAIEFSGPRGILFGVELIDENGTTNVDFGRVLDGGDIDHTPVGDLTASDARKVFGRVLSELLKDIAQNRRSVYQIKGFTPQLQRIYAEMARRSKLPRGYRLEATDEALRLVRNDTEELFADSTNELFQEGEGFRPAQFFARLFTRARADGYNGTSTGEAAEWLRAKEKGLDMSTEARMQRARDMGFDVDTKLFHGSRNDVRSFDYLKRGSKTGAPSAKLAFFLASNPKTAAVYAERGTVMPLFARLRNPLVYDYKGEALVGKPREVSFADLIRQAEREGRDGVIMRNTFDGGHEQIPFTKEEVERIVADMQAGTRSPDRPQRRSQRIIGDIYAVFSAKDIRSVNAAFDPDESSSFDLLAQDEFFADETNERPTPRELLDALIADLRNERAVYSIRDADAVASNQEREDQLRWFESRGIDLTKNKDAIREQIARALEKEADDPNAVSPDLAAMWFGFESGAALMDALRNLKPRAAAIEEGIDARLEAEYGDPFRDGSIAEAARAAANTEAQARVLELELAAIERAAGGRVTPVNRAAKRFAENAVNRMSVREVQGYDKFLAGERRASRNAMEALKKGDHQQAAMHKSRQIASLHLYNLARAAAEDMDRARRFFRKFDRQSIRQNIAPQHLERIDEALENVDLRAKPRLSGQRRASLQAWIADMQEQGLDHMIDPAALEALGRRPFDTLTVEEAKALRDAVRNFEHIGRRWREVLQARDKRKFEEVVTDLVTQIESVGTITDDSIKGLSPTLMESANNLRLKAHAEHTKPEFLFRLLDGLKDSGPVWRAMFAPVARAEDAELTMRNESAARLANIFSTYSRKERARLFRKKELVPEVAMPLSRAEMIAIALNWGNEGNREALMEGYGWSEAQVQAVLNRLDQRDWSVVQGIFDWLEEYREPSFALQERLTGVRPEAVEATPINTRFGPMRGGYYPLRYRTDTGEQAFRRDEKVTTLEEFGSNWIRPQTRKGHLIERVGSGGQKPRLDMGVLTEHVENVIHDITHREAVIDNLRLINNERMEAAIKGAVGREAFRVLRPWLSRIAADKKDPTTVLEKTLLRLRMGAQVVNMGWKLSTALVQPLGLLPAIPRVGAGPLLKQAFAFLGNPAGMKSKLEFVFSRSTMMKNRMATFDRDVRDAMNRLKGRADADPLPVGLRQSMFWLTGAFDMGVSVPTWLAAYDNAKSGKVDNISPTDEQAAIEHADSTVRTTQGAGGVKDLAEIAGSKREIMRLFTMFYSYFSVLYNQLYAEQAPGVRSGRISKTAFVANMALIWFLPAALSLAIQGRLDKEEDEEDDEWALRVSKEVGLYPLASIVGVRDAVNALGTKYDYEISPVTEAGERTVGAGNRLLQIGLKTVEGEDIEEREIRSAMKDTTLALGYWFGLPARQAWTTGEYAFDVVTGEEEPLEDPGRIYTEGLLRDTE